MSNFQIGAVSFQEQMIRNALLQYCSFLVALYSKWSINDLKIVGSPQKATSGDDMVELYKQMQSLRIELENEKDKNSKLEARIAERNDVEV